MSPILQSLANASAYGYRSFVTAAATSFESIATVTVGSGGSSTITFSSIPQTYTHLQLRSLKHLSGSASDYSLIKINFNSDTNTNYAYHRLFGNGATVSSDGEPSKTASFDTWAPDDLTMADAYGVSVLDVLDYANTNKYKTIRSLGGFDRNGSGFVALFSGLWQSTNAITRIDLVSNSGQNFDQYSHFALYGIKGA